MSAPTPMRRPTRRPARHAATLIEAVVAFVLVGILAGMAFPTFAAVNGQFSQARAEQAGWDLENRIRNVAAADAGPHADPRQVGYLDTATDTWHPLATVDGIDDSDSDGIDDDGALTLWWDNVAVCVALSDSPTVPGEVTLGPCA